MVAFLSAHAFWVGVAALWIFSAFVSGMPTPDQNSGKAYTWAYSSLHLLSANLSNAFASKIPGSKPTA